MTRTSRHSQYQQYPDRDSGILSRVVGRRRLVGGAVATAGLAVAGAALYEYNAAERRRNAELDAQLARQLRPAMSLMNRQILAAYNAATTSGAENALRSVFNPRTGTVTISGSVDRSFGESDSGVDLGYLRHGLTVVMGADAQGRPNPDDPRYASVSRYSSGDAGTLTDVQMAVDSGRQYDELGIAQQGSGWFAGYTSGYNGDKTDAYASTDDRQVWAGDQNPNPMGVATTAVELAIGPDGILPGVLQAFRPQDQ